MVRSTLSKHVYWPAYTASVSRLYLSKYCQKSALNRVGYLNPAAVLSVSDVARRRDTTSRPQPGIECRSALSHVHSPAIPMGLRVPSSRRFATNTEPQVRHFAMDFDADSVLGISLIILLEEYFGRGYHFRWPKRRPETGPSTTATAWSEAGRRCATTAPTRFARRGMLGTSRSNPERRIGRVFRPEIGEERNPSVRYQGQAVGIQPVTRGGNPVNN